MTIPAPVCAVIDTERDGLPAIVTVNRALLGFEHANEYAWHLVVALTPRAFAANGMPSSNEARSLADEEDRIENILLEENAIFLARQTWNRTRVCFYRVADPELANQALTRSIATSAHEREWEY